ncbi:MAG: glycosyltransferase [Hyphomicrobium sp.]
MSLLAQIAAVGLIAAHALQLGTALATVRRLRSKAACVQPTTIQPPLPDVSIIVPVTQLDHAAEQTLSSVFLLREPAYEILFCVPREDDEAVALIRLLMSRHSDVPARLLIGRDQFTHNPKLDNLEKGWAAARNDWIVIADGNVLLPPDSLRRLFSVWDHDTGLVCSPPVGTDPMSFAGEIECAFLNTYQARLQLAADSLGWGFAHGKVMMFHRSLLDDCGGIRGLSFDIAEDCAATKVVRRQRLHVRLTDRPFAQPVGPRRLTQVWHRHLRWAQLRRQSFPLQYSVEFLTTCLTPLVAAIVLAGEIGLSRTGLGATSLGLWLTVEGGLAFAAGWPSRLRYFPACLCRDVLIAAIWPIAWFRSRYMWRGNEIAMKAVAQRKRTSTS